MSRVQVPDAFEGLFKPHRYKAFYGGRGSAKSHSIATALVVIGAQKQTRILCAREIQKSIADSVKRLLEDKIKALGLDGFYSSTLTDIKGKNGTEFIFAGLRTNPESIKSLEGIDIAWVEEAATVSQSSLDILIPTIRKEGSELWFSWNPRFKSDPIDVMFREKEPPNSLVKRVLWSDNRWFPDVLKQELEWDRERDPDKYAHIWLGEYQRNSEARVFRNWRIDRLDVPSDARPYFGADWGFAIDPTVLVRAYLWDRTLYIDAEAHKIGCEIDRTPQLFDQISGSREWPITADSSRPETISFMRRAGFNIHGAEKGPNSVKDGVEFLKSVDIVVHPKCTHLIDELTLYSWKTDKLTNEILPVLEDKKNHVIDALRYALEATRKAVPKLDEVEFCAGPPQHSGGWLGV